MGGISAVLALLGLDVRCVCYSKDLSVRDFKFFEKLFENLGLINQKDINDKIIDDKIKYDTIAGFFEE